MPRKTTTKTGEGVQMTKTVVPKFDASKVQVVEGSNPGSDVMEVEVPANRDQKRSNPFNVTRPPAKFNVITVQGGANSGVEATGDHDSEVVNTGGPRETPGSMHSAKNLPCMACKTDSRYLQHSPWCEKAPK